MRSRIFGLLCFFLAALTCSGQSFALVMGARTDKVSADVFTSADELNPQAGIDLLLRLQMHNGWHTYWSNPVMPGCRPALNGLFPKVMKLKPGSKACRKNLLLTGWFNMAMTKRLIGSFV